MPRRTTPPSITLYDYQATKVQTALRHVRAGRDVLLEEPTVPKMIADHFPGIDTDRERRSAMVKRGWVRRRAQPIPEAT